MLAPSKVRALLSPAMRTTLSENEVADLSAAVHALADIVACVYQQTASSEIDSLHETRSLMDDFAFLIERAAICEFCGGLTSTQANKAAYTDIKSGNNNRSEDEI